MSTTKDILLRAARDRLVDLLGFGETYPLQDVEVRKERQTVPVDTTAKIPILPGQTGVRYKLHDLDEKPLKPGPGKIGTGAETLLETPPVDEDVTYKILARKIDSKRQAYLHQTAAVRVGLDATLDARILAPLLDTGIETPADTDPRLVDYGSRVEVEVADSQEGVDYHLVHFPEGSNDEVVLSEQKRGNLSHVELETEPVFEDTKIRVRATRTFDPSEDRAPQSTLLDVVLPLAVRADPVLAVAVEPSPVIGFGDSATIVLSGSQQTVSYRLYARTLSDWDFVCGATPDSDVLRVAGGKEPPAPAHEVLVSRKPKEPFRRQAAAVGEPQPGTGGELRLPLGPLEEDTVVIVEASKEHRVTEEQTLPSTLQLEQAAVLLVCPDPAPPDLALEVPVADGKLSGTLRVTGGQPGVFYYFRRDDRGERSRPAYFHQLDELEADPSSPAANKGLGQLRLEGDFAVARDPAAGAAGPPATVRPPAPVVDIERLALDLVLHGRAVKARTGVSVPLSASVEIAAPSIVEAFAVDTPDVTDGSYPDFTLSGDTASVSGGALLLHGIFTRGHGLSGDLVVTAKMKNESGGNFSAGIEFGNRRFVFHPGYWNGAFRIENTSVGNTHMGFRPSVNAFHPITLEWSSATGVVKITVEDGDRVAGPFVYEWTADAGFDPGAAVGFYSGGESFFKDLEIRRSLPDGSESTQ